MRLSAQNRKVAGARDPSERQRQRTKQRTADGRDRGTDGRTKAEALEKHRVSCTSFGNAESRLGRAEGSAR